MPEHAHGTTPTPHTVAGLRAAESTYSHIFALAHGIISGGALQLLWTELILLGTRTLRP